MQAKNSALAQKFLQSIAQQGKEKEVLQRKAPLSLNSNVKEKKMTETVNAIKGTTAWSVVQSANLPLDEWNKVLNDDQYPVPRKQGDSLDLFQYMTMYSSDLPVLKSLLKYPKIITACRLVHICCLNAGNAMCSSFATEALKLVLQEVKQQHLKVSDLEYQGKSVLECCQTIDNLKTVVSELNLQVSHLNSKGFSAAHMVLKKNLVQTLVHLGADIWQNP